MIDRININDYFMEIAQVVSKRSTCLRRQVGAIIVKNKHILSTGYNGAPSGITHCAERGCLRDKLNIPSGEQHSMCYASHAEMNAIAQAAYHGISIKDSILYCTHQPCFICAKLIINSGIKTVYFNDNYPDVRTKDLFNEANIELYSIKD